LGENLGKRVFENATLLTGNPLSLELNQNSISWVDADESQTKSIHRT
jgi:hypothetical protein